MDKLLERCAKHRQATRDRKLKRIRSLRRNTAKLKQGTLATTPAQQPPTQTTNQQRKVAKNESSKQVSTTKHAKDWQQAQTPLEPRKMKPDGTPKNPDSNPVMEHSTVTPDGMKIKLSQETASMVDSIIEAENKHGNSAISIARPDSQAPDIKQIDPFRTTTDPILTIPEAIEAKALAAGKKGNGENAGRPGPKPTRPAQTASHAPDIDKTESKTGEGGNGLTSAGALTPARESASSANKLSQAQRSHIYQLIGAGYRNTTILAHIRHNLGIKVSRQSISEMRHRQPERVEQGRRDIQKEIGLAAPIANKIHRIAKRQELINSLERKLWRTTSITKGGTRLLTGTHETINRILDSVKAELEPYEVNLSVDLRGKTEQQYRDVSDQGVISEAMDKLKAAGMEVAQVVTPTETDK